MGRSHTKILVVRFSSLGDILLATPALRAIKRWRPESRVDFLLKSEYAELLQENPHVDTVIPWDASSGTRDLLLLARRLRGRYDLLVDLHRSLRSLLLRWRIRAGRTLRYPKGVIGRSLMIHTGWKVLARKDPVPDRYLQALEPLGILPDDRGLDFLIPESTRSRVDEILTEGGTQPATPPPGSSLSGRKGMGPATSIFCVAPGARWMTKRWLPERFAQVADTISDRYHLLPVLIGHRQDLDVVQEVRGRMRRPLLDLTGRLGLLETGALIERSQLLLCNDSGLMHMAAALSTPIVAVFGPTTRELGFYPYRSEAEILASDLPCRPCHHLGSARCPKGHHRCMKDVTAGEVIEAAMRIMDPQAATSILREGRTGAIP